MARRKGSKRAREGGLTPPYRRPDSSRPRAQPRPAGSSKAPPAGTGTGTWTVAETALVLLAQSDLLVSWADAAELQRVSLALCEACRRCVPVRVRVDASTPRAVWAHGDGGGGGGNSSGGTGGGGIESPDWQRNKGKGRRRRRRQQQQTGGGGPGGGGGGGGSGAGGQRVPRLHISSMVWEAPANHLGDGGGLPPALRELTFGRDFNRALTGILWPRGLERLTFGSRFNRELVQRRDGSGARQAGSDTAVAAAAAAATTAPAAAAGAAGGVSGVDRHEENSEEMPAGACLLPGNLKELTFGKQFNKPLPRGRLPPGLVSLTLGRNFRQRGSVRDAVWPLGLKVIRFGEAMLRRERRDWPLLEEMRGCIPPPSSPLPSSSTPPPPEGPEKRAFAWPAGLDRVEFWKEGRAVVSLKGGTAIESDSLEWLSSN